ncbi:MAG TPA: hypothetical protein VHF69_06450 [Candidatus Synoicihabitans sp.]|nr:hypothetical protein [Candidatus Synoicihabitans sp.]
MKRSHSFRLFRSASAVLTLALWWPSLAVSSEPVASVSLPVVAFPKNALFSRVSEPEHDAAIGAAVALVPVPRFVARGTSAGDVAAELGAPALKLGPDAWIYWNYQTVAPGGAEFDTLVVLFSGGRVSQIRLVSRDAVEALAARLAGRVSGPGRLVDMTPARLRSPPAAAGW